jgi:hypothetical protein
VSTRERIACILSLRVTIASDSWVGISRSSGARGCESRHTGLSAWRHSIAHANAGMERDDSVGKKAAVLFYGMKCLL